MTKKVKCVLRLTNLNHFLKSSVLDMYKEKNSLYKFPIKQIGTFNESLF